MLVGNLKLAAAQIQRLGTENALLREALDNSSNITRIRRPGSQLFPPSLVHGDQQRRC
jgi:hypothetical protein